MPYIPPEVVEQARQIDLLTYLQSCEPQELVRISGNNYTTRTHDSLKISNGKWMWWSQRIGGYNALDYLVKVKGCSFAEAVETLMGKAAVMPSVAIKSKQKAEPKVLLLPDKSATTDKITEYLFGRGIDYTIIQYCIDKGLIFESLPYHNLVCVGFDEKNSPRYASFRATNDRRVWVTAPAAISTILFGSQTATAARCIFLSVPLTCFPLQHLKGWQAGIGVQTTLFPSPGCICPRRKSRTVPRLRLL